MAIVETYEVTLVATANLTLFGDGQFDEGTHGTLLSAHPGGTILLTAQTNPVENGPWTYGAGAWSRMSPFGEGEETSFLLRGTAFVVAEGDYQNSVWRATSPSSSTPSIDPTSYRIVEKPVGPPEPGSGIDESPTGVWSLKNIVAGGTVAYPSSLTFNSEGRITDAASGAVGSGYIEGLGLEYVSATQVRLNVGAAAIPGPNRIVEVSAPITADQLNNDPNAVYYAYLYETNRVGQLELSDTAPASPYFGSARTMTLNTSRRYLGMIKNNSLGQVMEFEGEVQGGSSVLITYGVHVNADHRIVNADGSTTVQTKSVGPSALIAQERLVSPTARLGWVYYDLSNITATGEARIGAQPNLTGMPPVYAKDADGYRLVRFGPNQEFSWQMVNAGNSISVYVAGYYERR